MSHLPFYEFRGCLLEVVLVAGWQAIFIANHKLEYQGIVTNLTTLSKQPTQQIVPSYYSCSAATTASSSGLHSIFTTDYIWFFHQETKTCFSVVAIIRYATQHTILYIHVFRGSLNIIKLKPTSKFQCMSTSIITSHVWLFYWMGQILRCVAFFVYCNCATRKTTVQFEILDNLQVRDFPYSTLQGQMSDKLLYYMLL